MPADEALAHGIVSRVVPADELDATVREMAEQIAAAPGGHGEDGARGDPPPGAARQSASSMDDEMIYQTFINRSDDFAELRPRGPRIARHYTGS